MICLNHDSRKDYDLVIVEGEKWLTQAKPNEMQSDVGLGIRWETARAQQLKAHSKTTELSANERSKLLQQALTNIRYVQQHPGSYQHHAKLKYRELLEAIKQLQ